MTHSATSCGLNDNMNYADCGGKAETFPQATIYDSLYESGVSFRMYANSSLPFCPELELDGVSRHKWHCRAGHEFYKDAAEGNLPAFSFIAPPGEGCDHPCHDMAKGERVLKDIYEALRSGPGWEKTMLFVAYDDGGGFYDHVVPPMEGVPDDESPCQYGGNMTKKAEGCHKPFDFRRLGIRVTSMLLSPWIPANTAVRTPKNGPTPTSQFDLTSGIATAKTLFNLSSCPRPPGAVKP
jgi:phospholipase C